MQLNNPRRIISLVPSQTELLYDLGLEDEVIGITKFCIHPEKWFRTKTRVGGTKTVKIDIVKALQPDLILANKEENVKEQVEELSAIAPVYTSDIKTFEDALQMIQEVGRLLGKEEKATGMSQKIASDFNKLQLLNSQYLPPGSPIKTAYLIWKEPYMAAGGDTFINDMLETCGLENVFKHLDRYPEVFIPAVSDGADLETPNHPAALPKPVLTSHQLSPKNCQLLLLSSEPYPFKQKHVDELQQRLGIKTLLVDGEMFSWYGSRMLKAASYFQQLIKEVHKL